MSVDGGDVIHRVEHVGRKDEYMAESGSLGGGTCILVRGTGLVFS
jgi:hypothetical protein